jgi:hypothetical protein
MGPPEVSKTAANLLPSADEVTDDQYPAGTLFDVQVSPKFVDE